MGDVTDQASLIADLEQAVEMSSHYSGGWSDHHRSAQEFHLDLVKKVEMLKNGDRSVLGELSVWFAPSYDWDDFVGEEGMALANRISEKLRMELIKDGLL